MGDDQMRQDRAYAEWYGHKPFGPFQILRQISPKLKQQCIVTAKSRLLEIYPCEQDRSICYYLLCLPYLASDESYYHFTNLYIQYMKIYTT